MVSFVCAGVLSAQTKTGTTTTTTTRTTTEPTRSVPSVSPPAPAPPSSTSSFLIPGGGSIYNTPLWLKLTKIICGVPTNDGSPNDEVYVVMVSVLENRETPSASQVFVSSTRVYDGMDYEDVRSVSYPVWGTEDSEAIPVQYQRYPIVLLAMYEHDNGNVLLSTQIVRAAVLKAISSLQPYANVRDKVRYAMADALASTVQTSGGDDPIAGPSYGPAFLEITNQDLDAARHGTVVRKPFEFYDFGGTGEKGSYTLRFQLGKQGMSSVVW